LSDVLLDHVVVGIVNATTVVQNGCTELETAGGLKIAVRYNPTTEVVDVNGITVSDPDILGDFGIMHGINGVLLEGSSEYVPCPVPSVQEQVAQTGEYTTLLGYLADPTLESTVQGFEPFTMFGPNDAAMAAVEIAPDDLIPTLGNHLVSGTYTAEDVKKAGCVVLATVLGGSIRAMYVEGDEDHDGHDHDHDNMGGSYRGRKLAGHAAKEGYIMINEAKVILADIADGTNIFHGIDTVLLSTETFKCPTKAPTEAPVASPVVAPTTKAPVASPTAADEGGDEVDEKENTDDSSASVTGFSAAMTAIFALSTFIF